MPTSDDISRLLGGGAHNDPPKSMKESPPNEEIISDHDDDGRSDNFCCNVSLTSSQFHACDLDERVCNAPRLRTTYCIASGGESLDELECQKLEYLRVRDELTLVLISILDKETETHGIILVIYMAYSLRPEG